MHFLRHARRFVPLCLPSLFVVVIDLAVSSSCRLPHGYRRRHWRKLLLSSWSSVAWSSLWWVSSGLLLLVWRHSVLLLLHRWSSILLRRCVVLTIWLMLMLMMASIHLLALWLLKAAMHRCLLLLHVVVSRLLVATLLLVWLLVFCKGETKLALRFSKTKEHTY